LSIIFHGEGGGDLFDHNMSRHHAADVEKVWRVLFFLYFERVADGRKGFDTHIPLNVKTRLFRFVIQGLEHGRIRQA
jgi:hypothetical protein